jgi:hypothetical protein
VKGRLNLILVCILAVQLAIILFFDRPWSSGYTRESAGPEMLFQGFAVDDAAAYRISSAEQEITLERKKPKEWFIITESGEYRADLGWTKRLLEAIERTQKLDVVSDNPESWKNYEVEGEKGTRIEVWGEDGSVLVDAYVGKNLGPMKGTFVRLGGSNEVYLVMENLRKGIEPGDNWIHKLRDRKIHMYNRPRAIAFLHIDGPHGRITIERRATETEDGEKDVQWLLTHPIEGVASRMAVGQMLAVLGKVKAQEFVPAGTKPEEVGLEPPMVTLTLGKLDGETVVFKVSETGKGGMNKLLRYLTASNKPGEIFRVPALNYRYFTLAPEDYLEGSEQFKGKEKIMIPTDDIREE